MPERCTQRCIIRRNDAGIGFDAVWRGTSLLVNVLLDGHRYAMQRADGARSGKRFVMVASLFDGGITQIGMVTERRRDRG